MLVYGRILSEAERQAVEMYLSRKYSGGPPPAGSLQFSAASYSVNENGATATITDDDGPTPRGDHGGGCGAGAGGTLLALLTLTGVTLRVRRS